MMNECNWEVIDDFRSLIEFQRFEKWLEYQVESNMTIEIKVLEYYVSPNTKERWFRCLGTQDIWRLVYPDTPFTGYWGPISLSIDSIHTPH